MRNKSLLLFLYTDFPIQNSFFLSHSVCTITARVNILQTNIYIYIYVYIYISRKLRLIKYQISLTRFYAWWVSFSLCSMLNERALFDALCCCLGLLHFRCGQNFCVLFVLTCLLVDPSITALMTDWKFSDHVGCIPLSPLKIIHVPLSFQYRQGISQKSFLWNLRVNSLWPYKF